MKDLLKFSWQPELKGPSMIIGWSVDASKLGAKVADYLISKLGGKSFCEIEPVEFFSLGGVTIEDNIVQFPESKFFAIPEHDLIVLKSNPPGAGFYQFLDLILDVCQQCHVKDIYTIGGIISLSAHSTTRGLLGTFNFAEFKNSLSGYGLSADWDYETIAGQRPSMNSFLLWAARRKNLPGVTLWASIPFYLSTVDDPQSRKASLDFFKRRFNLGIDLSDVDEAVNRQNQAISELRNRVPEVDKSIKKLENNLQLSDEESQELMKEIEKSLKESSYG